MPTACSRRGVRKGDNVALLARNGLEWALVDFALARIGAVGIPVYASSSPKDVGYLLAHSEAIAVVCEDAEQLAKVEAVTDDLPALRHVLTYHDLEGLAAHGADFAAANPAALDEATAAVTEDDLYTIIYTSGTTGPPKGCMLSNRNYFEMATVVDQDGDDLLPARRRHAPLPSARAQLRPVDALARGARGVHDRVPRRSVAGRRSAAAGTATLLPSVPRVYEKVTRPSVARFDAATGVKKRLLDWALPIGREVSRLEGAGEPVPAGLRRKQRLADKLVFSKVREPFGGRLRMPGSGGAPLSKEIVEFFDAVGIRITEGYGLTECTTAASTNRPDLYRFGPWADRSRASRCASPTTARSRSGRDHVPGLLQGPEATAAVLSPSAG